MGNPLLDAPAPYRFYASYPLEAPGGHRVGTFCLLDPNPRHLSEAERETLRDLAEYVQQELTLDEEFDRAAQVQRSLLPRTVPQVPGFELAGVCLPARAVGGDFFDWYEIDGGAEITVADVMGKGVGAAMIAATVRSALRIALPTGGALESLARVASVVQADLANNEAFVTMFHARLRSASGELTVVDAGHGLAVLVRADGSTELMPSQNLPLGVLVGQEWKVTRHSMRTGDLLLLFGDGVLDLFDGTLDALRQAAAAASKGVHTAQDAVDRIVKLASGAQDDDVTVIAVQRVA